MCLRLTVNSTCRDDQGICGMTCHQKPCVKPSLLHIQEHLQLTDRQFLLLSASLVHSSRFQLPRHVKATCEHIRCILRRVPDNMLLSHSICSIPWCFFSGQYFTPQCTSEVQDRDPVRVFGTRLSWHSTLLCSRI